jgi:hypothetical protein
MQSGLVRRCRDQQADGAKKKLRMRKEVVENKQVLSGFENTFLLEFFNPKK